MSGDPSSNGLVSVAEAAAALGLPRRTLGYHLERGHLPTASRVGQRRLVDVEALRVLIEERRASARVGRRGRPTVRVDPSTLLSTLYAQSVEQLRRETDARLAGLRREVEALLGEALAQIRALGERLAAMACPGGDEACEAVVLGLQGGAGPPVRAASRHRSLQ